MDREVIAAARPQYRKPSDIAAEHERGRL